ncbi:hypothetical protein CkaCkLH20_03725 [Colletotrichum karsti]|uniref:Short-chain dehydrogenase n=1 Tax=Colletotrichum karsti TaxID=1095194 RepID=A0A9P6IA81_9PEZI|nr:uncharacterized protein CkaCkLH20_03725 [Colletotrichum karsti]KAF9878825.1 hypothetical protein CkaCkLH20_03725 [Colletotrichum karsti]
MSSIIQFIHSQVFTEVPLPTKKFTGQTIIVTGSNTGLGFEAAKHLVRLEASRVILAVRSLSKGHAATALIEESTGRKGVVEVWELDLASYASVKEFANRVNGLERLDVLINNAGVMTYDFILAGKDDMMMTVNVVSPVLLTLLLLPKMRETSLAHDRDSVITFVGSLGHSQVDLVDSQNKRIFEALAVEETARMADRYNISKLILLQLARELANKVTESNKPGNVIVSVLNPGVSDTEISRHVTWLHGKILKMVFAIIGRTPEEASRTLVLAAEGAQETHGQYLDDGKVGKPSEFVLSQEGARVQQQLWYELLEKLDEVSPGIANLI